MTIQEATIELKKKFPEFTKEVVWETINPDYKFTKLYLNSCMAIAICSPLTGLIIYNSKSYSQYKDGKWKDFFKCRLIVISIFPNQH